MTTRRGILAILGTALGAGAVAPQAAARLGVKEAAALLGVSPDAPLSEVMASSPEPSGLAAFWRAHNLIQIREMALRSPVESMPPHISEKRSWSRAFKASTHAREQVLIEAARLQTQEDEATRSRFLTMLGLGRDE